MDAATAAAMSDPDRNAHFHRRWIEPITTTHIAVPNSSSGPIGTLGLALLDALARRRAAQGKSDATGSGGSAP